MSMASRKSDRAASVKERKQRVAEDHIYDPTARILDQYWAESEAFERQQPPPARRFGRSTVALPYRGEPEGAGEAFNPLNALRRRH
jgi:hypothetical protein